MPTIKFDPEKHVAALAMRGVDPYVVIMDKETGSVLVSIRADHFERIGEFYLETIYEDRPEVLH